MNQCFLIKLIRIRKIDFHLKLTSLKILLISKHALINADNLFKIRQLVVVNKEMNNSFLSSVLRFGSISSISVRNFSRTISNRSHSVRKCNSSSTLFLHLVHTLSSRGIFLNRPVSIARSWFPHLNLHIFLQFSLFFITRRYGSIEKSCLTRL